MANSGYEFGDDVEYVESAPEEGRVQWFHHKKSVDPTGKKLLGDIYGWCIQAGRWDYLDKVCEKAGLKQYHVKQDGNINSYWQLGSASEDQSEWGSARFFVLAKGMLSENQMGITGGGKRGFNGVRAGIAEGWGKRKGDDKPQRSLKFRAFPEELLAQGLERPVIVSVSGKSKVDDLVAALGKDGHDRVIRANNARLEQSGKAPKTPYAGFSLALLAGDQTEEQQQGGGQGSPVTKIVTDIPATIDDAFLNDHHASGWWPLIWQDIKTNGYSVEWSKEASQEIYAGAGNGSDEESESPSSSAGNFDDHPFDVSDDGLIGPDGEYTTMPVEFRAEQGSKPAAKPAPSNNIKPLTDEQLKNLPGTAVFNQRKALQNLGRPDIAQKSGLSAKEAGEAIMSANKARKR